MQLIKILFLKLIQASSVLAGGIQAPSVAIYIHTRTLYIIPAYISYLTYITYFIYTHYAYYSICLVWIRYCPKPDICIWCKIRSPAWLTVCLKYGREIPDNLNINGYFHIYCTYLVTYNWYIQKCNANSISIYTSKRYISVGYRYRVSAATGIEHTGLTKS